MPKRRTMKYKVIGWAGYDEDYPSFQAETEAQEMGARVAVVEEIRTKGYVFGGDSHQYHPCGAPVLNNGQMFRCGQRTWGRIIAEAKGTDNSDGYSYAMWFLDDVIDEPLVYPPYGVDESQIAPRGTVFEGDETYQPQTTTEQNYLDMLKRVSQFAIEMNMLIMDSPEDSTEHPLVVTMRLNESPFNQMYNGEKTVEIRLNDSKRQRLQAGDTVQFVCTADETRHIRTEIVAVHLFDSFKDLYNSPLKDATGAGDMDLQQFVDCMHGYYSPEKERQFGVCALQLKIISK